MTLGLSDDVHAPTFSHPEYYMADTQPIRDNKVHAGEQGDNADSGKGLSWTSLISLLFSFYNVIITMLWLSAF